MRVLADIANAIIGQPQNEVCYSQSPSLSVSRTPSPFDTPGTPPRIPIFSDNIPHGIMRTEPQVHALEEGLGRIPINHGTQDLQLRATIDLLNAARRNRS